MYCFIIQFRVAKDVVILLVQYLEGDTRVVSLW